MLPQTFIHPHGKAAPLPADLDRVAIQLETALSATSSETAGTAVLVTKFNDAHYCHRDLLHSADKIDDPGNLLRVKGIARVLFFTQIFRAYACDLAIGKILHHNHHHCKPFRCVRMCFVDHASCF